MAGAIYLIHGDGELVEMTQQPYDSEELLQRLLARYPSLLAGNQINPSAPRRWLFVSREASIPSEEQGADRWAVDHLFLDQDGIPTLVEVKRSDDTRIRREVVGQMLDYAANAVVYWPIERLRAQFEASCQGEGGDPGQVLDEFLGGGMNHEEFWQMVKTNLQAGKVRLVFVADEIPAELRRVIEFLNAQTDPAEVLGVEIPQYVHGERGLRTLVPRVIGQTAEAERKGIGRGPRWDRERFFAALRNSASSPEEFAVAEDLLNFGTEITARPVEWGTGKDRGSFTARLIVGDDRFSLFSIYTTGEFSVNWGWHSQRLGTNLSEKYRSEVNNKLGVSFDRLSWERGWPMADLSTLVSDKAACLKELVREFVARIQAGGDRPKQDE